MISLARCALIAAVAGTGLVTGCKSDGNKDAAARPASGSASAASTGVAAPSAPVLPVAHGPLGRSDAELGPLRESIRKLAPLHVRAAPPKNGEWLADHPENGQSFEQYLNDHPITPTPVRGALVVQPLGDLGKANERVVATVALAMEAFFGLPSRLAPPLSVTVIPRSARRPSRGYGEQLLTSQILRELIPRLPDDAMAYVAFTSSDLWPGNDWNYVFGQASLDDRVGVWSLARNGNPSADDAAYRLALVRALKIAMHETGHMFGMHHCTAYRCNMAGVNSLDESDAHPTWLCPECLAKLSWATGASPGEHLRRMHAFSRTAGLKAEESHYAKSLAALGKPPGSSL
jgi:archaemetzincin